MVALFPLRGLIFLWVQLMELDQVDEELAIEASELRRSQKLTRLRVERRLIRWVSSPAVTAGFT